MSSTRVTLAKSANGRKWYFHLGKKSVIDIHSCGPEGFLLLNQAWWG
jgi:hypothetical protein